jgi:glyoxylase-like metal-dependent hydrolase (beta-lactamase superfamily II)
VTPENCGDPGPFPNPLDPPDESDQLILACREKLLAGKRDVIFTGHGVRANGSEWLADLLKRSEDSLAKAAEK